RFGWPYAYGFYPPESDADGSEFRWTAQRAVAVLDAPTRWLSLTVSASHPALDRNPVDFTIWRDGEVVFKGRLTSPAPETATIEVPNERRMRIETWVSRVAKPGGAD